MRIEVALTGRLRPKFRQGFAQALAESSGETPLPEFSLEHALTVYDVIVEGCFATGNAERCIKPVPTITEGTWTVGVDFPAATHSTHSMTSLASVGDASM